MKRALFLSLLFFSAGYAHHAFAFAGGDGSTGNPYQIATCTDLQDMQNDVLAHYKLISDIDCSATATWNPDGSGGYYGFEPVGPDAGTGVSFDGSLDGDGHTILHLYINRPSTVNVGLFGDIDGATIENLTLDDVDIHSSDYAGAVVGVQEDGLISHVSVSGTVQGEDCIGGVVGLLVEGSVEDSSSAAGITAYDCAGGFVGGMVDASISQSYATGDVTATHDSAGGFIGSMNEGSIVDSYATGNVTANNAEAGGFVAGVYGGYITRSYASGNATLSPGSPGSVAAGFVGSLIEGQGEVIIGDSFTLSPVSSPYVSAGFTGIYNNSYAEEGQTDEFQDDFYDITRTGQTQCHNPDTVGLENEGCAGVNASSSDPNYFYNNDTNGPYSAWDFNTVWETTSGLPTLKVFDVVSTSTPVVPPPATTTTSTSTPAHHNSSHSGGSVQSQVANLTAMGNTAAAAALTAQYPQLFGASTPTATVAVPTATPTTGEAICTPYLTSYITLGGVNDPDQVKKLQTFLNTSEGESLTIDGVYKDADAEAVKRFQQKYASEVLGVWGLSAPTGNVYRTTQLKINALNCGSTVSCPYFTEYNSTTENSNTAEVGKTKELLKELGFFQGEVTNTFDATLASSLKTFQETFSATMLKPWGLTSGTGYKYKTTDKFLNMLVGCETPAVDLDGKGTFEY